MPSPVSWSVWFGISYLVHNLLSINHGSTCFKRITIEIQHRTALGNKVSDTRKLKFKMGKQQQQQQQSQHAAAIHLSSPSQSCKYGLSKSIHNTIMLSYPVTATFRRSQWPRRGMKCLRPLKHWDRGFESQLCFHSVFVLSCAGSGLVTGWSPVQGVLPSVYGIQISELINSEWAQAREPNPSR
jgi:hypothetical protein